MSSIVTQYSIPPTIRSVLLKTQPDAVPPTEELDALQNELKLVKLKTLERARKAGDDLRTIEESMRRLKEREKGKGKAIDKVKKERGSTCQVLTVLREVLTNIIPTSSISSYALPYAYLHIRIGHIAILWPSTSICHNNPHLFNSLSSYASQFFFNQWVEPLQ